MVPRSPVVHPSLNALTEPLGGGFVFGSLDADSRFCMSIREQVGLTVVDVNYRHCPG